MSSLCIIPARGGSKRIPRKNIKDFLGRPIITYSIGTALKSNLFDEIIVSTDDPEIASIALKYGAKVPFLRSEKNSDDYATTFDVIEEVVNMYKSIGKEFTTICCIYPCAPFVTVNHIKDASIKLVAQKLDTVFPIIEYGHPIQRSLRMNQDKVVMANPENKLKRSQDFESYYHDSGQFYFCNTINLLQKKTLMTDNSSSIIISELEAQDIDTLTDWRIAEFKYKLLNEKTSTL